MNTAGSTMFNGSVELSGSGTTRQVTSRTVNFNGITT